jgi:transcriptional regulator with XRE-family HTH domain
VPLSLKAARVNCNLTQEEAAKKIGVTPKMLSDWENGKSFPNVKRLPAILSTYGVGYDDLIFPTSDPE